jgi:beta-glucanase (GH16 family)
MRRFILCRMAHLVALIVCVANLHAQKAAPGPQQPDPADWALTFSDEFDRDLDLSKWTLHDPWGLARPREFQGYAAQAAQVSGGLLHLTATRDSVRYDGQDREFRSGIVSTFGTFSQAFGRFEIRCRIPAGGGLATSFRLFPARLAALPEIDVFGASGNEPTRVHFANHWGTEQTVRSFYDSYPAPDLSATFHTLAVEWDKSKIVWFIDGRETMRSTEGIPQQAMFLLVDLAVGGALDKAPSERTTFPASFDIDYIRVYRRR